MITYNILNEKEEILFNKTKERGIKWYGTDDLVAEYQLNIKWYMESVKVYNSYFDNYASIYYFSDFIDITLCLKYAIVMATIHVIDEME